jgi:hypothetical protein
MTRCRLCKYAIQSGTDLFCHGGPPTVFRLDDNRLSSTFPPVGVEMSCAVGCLSFVKWIREKIGVLSNG